MHCGEAWTHCGEAWTHCGKAWTHCDTGCSHCDTGSSHCDAMDVALRHAGCRTAHRSVRRQPAANTFATAAFSRPQLILSQRVTVKRRKNGQARHSQPSVSGILRCRRPKMSERRPVVNSGAMTGPKYKRILLKLSGEA